MFWTIETIVCLATGLDSGLHLERTIVIASLLSGFVVAIASYSATHLIDI